MLYREFLEHIYQKYSGNVKLELDRMVGLLREMHHPERSFGGMHIAGTNGKGSVCASLEALCLAYGLKTGLNTSPHLIDYTERFRLDGKDTDFPTILGIFHDFEELFDRWDASFFEITTSIAFELFRRNQIHTGIIEVGLGGRLDATNLFMPDVSAITTIGLDHIKTLGGTVEIIAREKAGIIKSGIPVVLGKIPESPLQIIIDIALERGAPYYLADTDYHLKLIDNGIEGVVFDYEFKHYRFKALHSNLIGEHQASNLAIAITSFILYCEKLGIDIAEDKIRKALGSVNWRGRMQLIRTKPYVLVDGAHNMQGVEALVANLRTIFPAKRFRFVFSILADKDFAKMLALICPEAELVYIAQNSSDRAATIEQQSAVLQNCGVSFKCANSVKEAYQMALDEASEQDVIVCGGSLYTVGEILNS